MIPIENEQVVFQDVSKINDNSKSLRIIHFNDVYNIECSKQEPVGGAARFATVLEELNEKKNCLIVFAGDAFSPSTCESNKK